MVSETGYRRGRGHRPPPVPTSNLKSGAMNRPSASAMLATYISSYQSGNYEEPSYRDSSGTVSTLDPSVSFDLPGEDDLIYPTRSYLQSHFRPQRQKLDTIIDGSEEELDVRPVRHRASLSSPIGSSLGDNGSSMYSPDSSATSGSTMKKSALGDDYDDQLADKIISNTLTRRRLAVQSSENHREENDVLDLVKSRLSGPRRGAGARDDGAVSSRRQTQISEGGRRDFGYNGHDVDFDVETSSVGVSNSPATTRSALSGSSPGTSEPSPPSATRIQDRLEQTRDHFSPLGSKIRAWEKSGVSLGKRVRRGGGGVTPGERLDTIFESRVRGRVGRKSDEMSVPSPPPSYSGSSLADYPDIRPLRPRSRSRGRKHEVSPGSDDDVCSSSQSSDTVGTPRASDGEARASVRRALWQVDSRIENAEAVGRLADAKERKQDDLDAVHAGPGVRDWREQFERCKAEETKKRKERSQKGGKEASPASSSERPPAWAFESPDSVQARLAVRLSRLRSEREDTVMDAAASPAVSLSTPSAAEPGEKGYQMLSSPSTDVDAIKLGIGLSPDTVTDSNGRAKGKRRETSSKSGHIKSETQRSHVRSSTAARPTKQTRADATASTTRTQTRRLKDSANGGNYSKQKRALPGSPFSLATTPLSSKSTAVTTPDTSTNGRSTRIHSAMGGAGGNGVTKTRSSKVQQSKHDHVASWRRQTHEYLSNNKENLGGMVASGKSRKSVKVSTKTAKRVSSLDRKGEKEQKVVSPEHDRSVSLELHDFTSSDDEVVSAPFVTKVPAARALRENAKGRNRSETRRSWEKGSMYKRTENVISDDDDDDDGDTQPQARPIPSPHPSLARSKHTPAKSQSPTTPVHPRYTRQTGGSVEEDSVEPHVPAATQQPKLSSHSLPLAPPHSGPNDRSKSNTRGDSASARNSRVGPGGVDPCGSVRDNAAPASHGHGRSDGHVTAENTGESGAVPEGLVAGGKGVQGGATTAGGSGGVPQPLGRLFEGVGDPRAPCPRCSTSSSVRQSDNELSEIHSGLGKQPQRGGSGVDPSGGTCAADGAKADESTCGDEVKSGSSKGAARTIMEHAVKNLSPVFPGAQQGSSQISPIALAAHLQQIQFSQSSGAGASLSLGETQPTSSHGQNASDVDASLAAVLTSLLAANASQRSAGSATSHPRSHTPSVASLSSAHAEHISSTSSVAASQPFSHPHQPSDHSSAASSAAAHKPPQPVRTLTSVGTNPMYPPASHVPSAPTQMPAPLPLNHMHTDNPALLQQVMQLLHLFRSYGAVGSDHGGRAPMPPSPPLGPQTRPHSSTEAHTCLSHSAISEGHPRPHTCPHSQEHVRPLSQARPSSHVAAHDPPSHTQASADYNHPDASTHPQPQQSQAPHLQAQAQSTVPQSQLHQAIWHPQIPLVLSQTPLPHTSTQPSNTPPPPPLPQPHSLPPQQLSTETPASATPSGVIPSGATSSGATPSGAVVSPLTPQGFQFLSSLVSFLGQLSQQQHQTYPTQPVAVPGETVSAPGETTHATDASENDTRLMQAKTKSAVASASNVRSPGLHRGVSAKGRHSDNVVRSARVDTEDPPAIIHPIAGSGYSSTLACPIQPQPLPTPATKKKVVPSRQSGVNGEGHPSHSGTTSPSSAHMDTPATIRSQSPHSEASSLTGGALAFTHPTSTHSARTHSSTEDRAETRGANHDSPHSHPLSEHSSGIPQHRSQSPSDVHQQIPRPSSAAHDRSQRPSRSPPASGTPGSSLSGVSVSRSQLSVPPTANVPEGTPSRGPNSDARRELTPTSSLSLSMPIRTPSGSTTPAGSDTYSSDFDGSSRAVSVTSSRGGGSIRSGQRVGSVDRSKGSGSIRAGERSPGRSVSSGDHNRAKRAAGSSRENSVVDANLPGSISGRPSSCSEGPLSPADVSTTTSPYPTLSSSSVRTNEISTPSITETASNMGSPAGVSGNVSGHGRCPSHSDRGQRGTEIDSDDESASDGLRAAMDQIRNLQGLLASTPSRM